MATDRELKSQTDLTNGLTAALEKLYGVMDRVATNSESQTQALLNFNDSMTNMSKNTGPAIENLESLNEAAAQTADTFDNQLTKSVDSLADVMSKRRKSFEKFEENLRMTKDIASILTNPLGKIIKTIPGMGKLGSAIGGVTKNTYNLFKEIRMSTSAMGKFALGAKAVGSILSAGVSLGIGAVNMGLKMFTGGLSLATSAVKGFISFATNIVTSIKDIAFGIVKTVFTIPMQIASVAADVGGKLRKIIVEEIGNASEDSKRLFDHASEVGKAVASIRQQAIDLIPAFASVRSEVTKLFGDNQNYIKKSQEAVDSLGQFADVYGAQISRGTKEVKMFERASQVLGLTAQDNLYLVGEAAKNGEAIYKAIQRRTDAAESVSKEFGLDRKRLSTNFNKLRVDIQNFAHISDPELYRVSARATELGLEVKGLTSIFNKFTTFEGAAQSAAQLSQAFGMNVDALDLIRAKDPMEIVYMFRDAMFQTGRSFDDLNRHERALLASQTGMSQEQLKMAMNFATAGKSMEETRKAMAEATPEAKQIKMFKNLTSSIKEFKKTLQFSSIFDAVSAGFKGMIASNKSVQKSFGLFSKGYEGIYEYMLELGNDPQIQMGLMSLGQTVSEIGQLLGGEEMKKVLLEGVKLVGNFISYVLFEFKKCGEGLALVNPFGKSIEEGLEKILKPDGPIMFIVNGLWKIGAAIAKKMLMGFLRIFPGIAISMLELVKTGVNGIVAYLSGNECSTDFRASFSKLVGCEDKAEIDRIVGNWSGLFKRIGDEAKQGSGGLFDLEAGPFARLFEWMKFQFDCIADRFGETILDKIALTKYGSQFFDKEYIAEAGERRKKRELEKAEFQNKKDQSSTGTPGQTKVKLVDELLKNFDKFFNNVIVGSTASDETTQVNMQESLLSIEKLKKVYEKMENNQGAVNISKLDELEKVIKERADKRFKLKMYEVLGYTSGEAKKDKIRGLELQKLIHSLNTTQKRGVSKERLSRGDITKNKTEAILHQKPQIVALKSSEIQSVLQNALDEIQSGIESGYYRENAQDSASVTVREPFRIKLPKVDSFLSEQNTGNNAENDRQFLKEVIRSEIESIKFNINLNVDDQVLGKVTAEAINRSPSTAATVRKALTAPYNLLNSNSEVSLSTNDSFASPRVINNQ